jgi:hypothetical protein
MNMAVKKVRAISFVAEWLVCHKAGLCFSEVVKESSQHSKYMLTEFLCMICVFEMRTVGVEIIQTWTAITWNSYPCALCGLHVQ